jgi:DNA gyrase/topoisomerase IV subunit A
MIRKDDVKWWVLEAKKHPESAPTIIEELAQRLVELDAENERLHDELIRLQRRAPAAADSAEVDALQRKVDTLQTLLDSKTSTEPSVVLFSNQLQSARMPLSQVQRLAREDRPLPGGRAPGGLRHLLLARPNAELLLLTSQGRGHKVLLADVEPLVEGSDWPAAEGPKLSSDEWLTAAVAVTEPPRFWTVVTRRGFVRQFLRISFDRQLAQGDQLVESPFRNDVPVAVVDGDEGDLLVLTRWGKGIRFSQRVIEGQGSVALELEPDDEAVAALPLLSDIQILVVTAAGFAVRRDTAQFKARSKPGGAGKTLIQAFDVLDVFPRDPEARLLYLTYSGKLALVPMADIPLHTRSRKGSRVRTFDRDPAVAVTFIPPEPRNR